MTTQLRDNRDVASYFVTKHSWRGKLVFHGMYNLKTKLIVVKLFVAKIMLIYVLLTVINFACFVRYKRVFSVGTAGIVTYNINTLEVTNQVNDSVLFD